ncbi:hypothetical protein SAMN04488570_3673 [Nocardioides scoriae]|uniref:Uncharacterized protein n=1 Tax=Nocardioides scoriae TaxID=642780 RepID=A0A1H1Y139_9ACTN|nr:hypothetical protein [Nocardioides scoriae]SDT15143.1 hypothetical protein SAMN04488570_3673 [Nocardioides scoriae]
MTALWFLLVLALGSGLLWWVLQRSKARELARKEAELAPVRQLVFEDVTALGVELQDLDLDLAGRQLTPGENSDYQRALDAYEAAKKAGDAITSPDQVKHVTEILEDGRYAMACVRARAAGEPLPVRRPPCFFDPRHGLSVEDVAYAPPGGAIRDVPACALDAERVKVGAEPDIRKVMVGSQRVPYWQGGRAYQPYAAGYFGAFGPMDWMFMGLLFGGGFDGLGEGIGAIGEGIGEGIGSIGDGIGGMFDGVGDMFDGFDF